LEATLIERVPLIVSPMDALGPRVRGPGLGAPGLRPHEKRRALGPGVRGPGLRGPRPRGGAAPADDPSTLMTDGRLWYKAGRPENTIDTGRASTIDNLLGNATYDAAQASSLLQAAYSATGFRGAEPGFTFDRTRGDFYTLGASPGSSYTAWAVMQLTAHTANQRFMSDADDGVGHFCFFTTTEAFRVNMATSITSTATALTSPMLLRWSYNSATGEVRISINNGADQVGAGTAGLAPAMDVLGANDALPISMVLAELAIDRAVHIGGSGVATSMASYIIDEYPALF
jgi:hypothetical protein